MQVFGHEALSFLYPRTKGPLPAFASSPLINPLLPEAISRQILKYSIR